MTEALNPEPLLRALHEAGVRHKKLLTEPGQIVWQLGELAHADMVAILRAAAGPEHVPGGGQHRR